MISDKAWILDLRMAGAGSAQADPYSLYDGFWEQFLEWIGQGGLNETAADRIVARLVEQDLSRDRKRHPIDDTELLYTLDPPSDYIDDTTLRQLSGVVERRPGGSPRVLARLHRQQLLGLEGRGNTQEETVRIM